MLRIVQKNNTAQKEVPPMPLQYVSITDFSSPRQVVQMLSVLYDSRGTKALLGVGAMMSRKTLNSFPSKWTDIFLPKERISEVFIWHNRVFNTLHYADYEKLDLLENLEKATTWCKGNLHAIQLDMAWPDPALIKAYRSCHPDIKVILRVSGVALDCVNNDPGELVGQLVIYGDAIDYCLLDKSMGRGLALDAKTLLPFARTIADKLPRLGIVVAGGLGPDTVHLAEPLVREIPGLSLDAQSRLRKSGSAKDPIDWPLAEDFLRKSLGLLASG